MRGVRFGGGAINRLKWLVHVLMLQWLWSWFALISRLSDIYVYILLHLPHDVLMSVWNNLFMTSWCNGCGVSLPPFPVSPIYTLLISLMMSSYSSFYDVLCMLLMMYRFALNILPSWKRRVELKLLRADHRRKGLTRRERRKRKQALGWYDRDCRRSIWRGLPAVLKTLEHDSSDMKYLWSQSLCRYVLVNIL